MLPHTWVSLQLTNSPVLVALLFLGLAHLLLTLLAWSMEYDRLRHSVTENYVVGALLLPILHMARLMLLGNNLVLCPTLYCVLSNAPLPPYIASFLAGAVFLTWAAWQVSVGRNVPPSCESRPHIPCGGCVASPAETSLPLGVPRVVSGGGISLPSDPASHLLDTTYWFASHLHRAMILREIV